MPCGVDHGSINATLKKIHPESSKNDGNYYDLVIVSERPIEYADQEHQPGIAVRHEDWKNVG